MFREMRRNERRLSSAESIAVLNEGNHGVLCTFGADEYPYGVPVHYVYHNGSVYFHCAVIGHKLDNIKNNPNVSFCVVGSDRVIPASFTTRYRSVIVFGKVKEVLKEEEKVDVLRAVVKKYAGKFENAGAKYTKANLASVRIFKIEIEQITGKANTTASCKVACPAGVNVPGYIALIKAGREKDAYDLIRQENPFPAVCGRICVHLCESKCVRGELDQAVAIKQLKRYAADYNLMDKEAYDEIAVTPNGKKVGIIGAGPSGLTCGYYLSRLGYTVEIFEAQSVAGGVMAFGMPEYRLPKKILQQEIKLIERAGVKIHLNVEIEKNIEDLKKKFDAVYVAVGSQFSKKLGLPGEELPGVYYGLDFLRDVNLHGKTNIGKEVVVVGGGNVAFDVARVAVRLGAEKVRIACLESRENMLAFPEEIKEGEEEGITIHNSKSFTRITNDQGKVTGIECIDVESCYFDEEKRPHIKVREGSEHIISADTVIFAIGQRPVNVEKYELAMARGNTIQIDNETLATSKEGVFAGGDAARGSVSVVSAIADGKKAAASIDKYLGGTGILNKGADIAVPEPEKIDEIIEQYRPSVKHLDPETRKDSFNEVNMGFDKSNAATECERCLRCDR